MFIDDERNMKLSPDFSDDCKHEEIDMLVLMLAQLHNNFMMQDKNNFDLPICRALRSSANLIEGKTSVLTNDDIKEAESVCNLLTIFKSLYDQSLKLEQKSDPKSSIRSRLYDVTFCDVLSRSDAILRLRTQ